jgi:hypothetical protein
VLAGGHGALLAAAKSLALDIAEGRAPRRQSLQRVDKLEDVQQSSAMCDMARSQAAKTQPNLVHPLLCVDAIQHGLRHGSAAGLAKEREVFNTCVHSEVGSALVHIFLSRVRAQHPRRIAQAASSSSAISHQVVCFSQKKRESARLETHVQTPARFALRCGSRRAAERRRVIS